MPSIPTASDMTPPFPQEPSPTLPGSATEQMLPSDTALCFVQNPEGSKGPYLLSQLRSMWNAGVLTADATVTWEDNDTPVKVQQLMAQEQAALARQNPQQSQRPEPVMDNDADSIPPKLPINGSKLKVTCKDLGNGRFSFQSSFPSAFSLVEQALTDCEVRIKERSLEKGLIRGTAKYGINLFGFSVTATFYAAGDGTNVDVTVTLVDAFDTFGACRKKVGQISQRIADLGLVNADRNTTDIASTASNGIAAPQYTKRAGESYYGKAVTGLCMSIGSLLFFLPGCIVGTIMCSMALRGIALSNNKAGKTCAVVGSIAGFFGIIWLLLRIIDS